jgi:hypothetical protein
MSLAHEFEEHFTRTAPLIRAFEGYNSDTGMDLGELEGLILEEFAQLSSLLLKLAMVVDHLTGEVAHLHEHVETD